MSGEKKPKGLVIKLSEAGAALGWIKKSGTNNFHGYKYATEADLVSALRQELYSRGVFIFPSVTSATRTPIKVVSRDRQGNVKERETSLTEIMMTWTFVDGETGETRECVMPGCGEDSGDKGIYKAMTGCEKYMLLKSFLVPTGDDPERDTVEEALQAQDAVIDRKLDNYKAKETKQAAGKVVEIYRGKVGNLNVWCFVKSEALALLLDSGGGPLTAFAGSSRYVMEEQLEKVHDVAAGLNMSLKEVSVPDSAKKPAEASQKAASAGKLPL